MSPRKRSSIKPRRKGHGKPNRGVVITYSRRRPKEIVVNDPFSSAGTLAFPTDSSDSSSGTSSADKHLQRLINQATGGNGKMVVTKDPSISPAARNNNKSFSSDVVSRSSSTLTSLQRSDTFKGVDVESPPPIEQARNCGSVPYLSRHDDDFLNDDLPSYLHKITDPYSRHAGDRDTERLSQVQKRHTGASRSKGSSIESEQKLISMELTCDSSQSSNFATEDDASPSVLGRFQVRKEQLQKSQTDVPLSALPIDHTLSKNLSTKSNPSVSSVSSITGKGGYTDTPSQNDISKATYQSLAMDFGEPLLCSTWAPTHDNSSSTAQLLAGMYCREPLLSSTRIAAAGAHPTAGNSSTVSGDNTIARGKAISWTQHDGASASHLQSQLPPVQQYTHSGRKRKRKEARHDAAARVHQESSTLAMIHGDFSPEPLLTSTRNPLPIPVRMEPTHGSSTVSSPHMTNIPCATRGRTSHSTPNAPDCTPRPSRITSRSNTSIGAKPDEDIPATQSTDSGESKTFINSPYQAPAQSSPFSNSMDSISPAVRGRVEQEISAIPLPVSAFSPEPLLTSTKNPLPAHTTEQIDSIWSTNYPTAVLSDTTAAFSDTTAHKQLPAVKQTTRPCPLVQEIAKRRSITDKGMAKWKAQHQSTQQQLPTSHVVQTKRRCPLVKEIAKLPAIANKCLQRKI